jgi:polyferredoxin
MLDCIVMKNCVTSAAPMDEEDRKIVRPSRHWSQLFRLAFQVMFLLLNVWIAVQFYAWVKQFETGLISGVTRPAGVEGWLPVASLIGIKYAIVTGSLPTMFRPGMFLIICFLAISFLFRKAFCSWLCPIGTLSEYLWKLGRRLFVRNPRLPSWGDIPLRGLKYALLCFFLCVIGLMDLHRVAAFLASPYAAIADVKMLNFFRFMGSGTAITLFILATASLVIKNVWCRYLCPYGALLGLTSLFSPVSIRRDAALCVSCGKCARACPSDLPVDDLVQISSAECTACFECVAACPASGALDASVGIPFVKSPRRKLSSIYVALGITLIFVGIVASAKASGNWHTKVPDDVYQRLVPRARETAHP